MTFFAAVQLRRGRDFDGSRAGWVVAIPDTSYQGRVIAPADADEDWIVEQLELMATKLGYAVACGRMASARGAHGRPVGRAAHQQKMRLSLLQGPRDHGRPGFEERAVD
jgi:hypothetical protein